jgi:predicted NUDIX family phosphoesterase
MAKMALVIHNIFKNKIHHRSFKFSPDPNANPREICDYFVNNFQKFTSIISPEALSTVQDFLMSRKEAEKNDNFLQLIPYVIIVRQAQDDKGNVRHEVLSYMRGQKGNENRLHGRVSIGIGGHIEEESSDDKDIWTVIKEAAEREIKEETGFDIAFKEAGDLRDRTHIFYQPIEEVASVHLALGIIVDVTGIENKAQENDEEGIIKPTWKTMKELYDGHCSGEFELEYWSLSVVVQNMEPAEF